MVIDKLKLIPRLASSFNHTLHQRSSVDLNRKELWSLSVLWRRAYHLCAVELEHFANVVLVQSLESNERSNHSTDNASICVGISSAPYGLSEHMIVNRALVVNMLSSKQPVETEDSADLKPPLSFPRLRQLLNQDLLALLLSFFKHGFGLLQPSINILNSTSSVSSWFLKWLGLFQAVLEAFLRSVWVLNVV